MEGRSMALIWGRSRRVGTFVSIFVLVLVVCVGLTGCGSRAAASGGDSSANKAAAIPRPEGVPEDFPNKNLTYIFPFGGGGELDAFAQAVFMKVKELGGWEHRILIENRTGGGGLVGWAAIADAEPDGYTFGFTASPMLQLPISDSKCTFTKDSYVHIGNYMTDPGAIAVGVDSDIESIDDLMALARTRPVTVATTGTTTSEARAVMQFQNEVPDAKLEIIPYNTEPEAIVALRGGHIDAVCLNVGNVYNDSKQGNLKVIATGGTERSSLFKDVATYHEQGYKVTQFSMRGFSYPEGVDPAIVAYMHDLFEAALKSEEVLEVAQNLGFVTDEKVYTDEELSAIWTDLTADLQALWDVAPWQ